MSAPLIPPVRLPVRVLEVLDALELLGSAGSTPAAVAQLLGRPVADVDAAIREAADLYLAVPLQGSPVRWLCLGSSRGGRPWAVRSLRRPELLA